MSKTATHRINFTKTILESLPAPPPGKRLFVYDIKGNGLHLVVTSGGQKTFYIRRRVNGKNEKHCIGPFPELSIEHAREKAARFVGAVAFGDNPAETRRLLRGEISLGEMFEEYREFHLEKSRKTSEETAKNFERWFGDWRSRNLSTISHHDIERRHGEIARDRGRYAANRALQLIRAIFNKGIAWHMYSGKNPAVGITLFTERPRERVLQADEFERFFRALEDTHQDFKDFVMLTLLTGARRSNVLSMNWNDISLTNATWRIPGQQSKNNQTQVIVLTELELSILERRAEARQDDHVFPSDSATGHLTTIKRAWKTFLERAGIKDLHIHDLRRSLASWMASTGANVSVIKSALHHKDVKTTLTVYARANRDSELAARQRAHETMLALGQSKRSDKIVPLKKRTPNQEC